MSSAKRPCSEVEGYVHQVSPVLQSVKAKYFTAVLQEADRNTRVVVFDMQHHNVFQCVEKDRSPVKLSGVRLSPSLQNQGRDDVLVNSYSRVSIIRRLPFAFDGLRATSDSKTLRDIANDVRQYQRVTVQVKVVRLLFQKQTLTRHNQQVLRKTYRIADKTLSMTLSVWGDGHIDVGHWCELQNVSVRKIGTKPRLSTTLQTKMTRLKDLGRFIETAEDDIVTMEGEIVDTQIRMPRPKKRSTIAKRLYAQRCASTEVPPLPLKTMAEASPPPLKTFKVEVTPLPHKKMADCSGSCNLGATQQVLPCPAIKPKAVLKGSFDQADARFGDSRNRQCGAISLTAVLKSKLKNVLTWTTEDLDAVLVAGTHLYESLRNQGNIKDCEVKGRNYIAVHELPRRHVLGNTAFSIEYTQSLTGFVNVNEFHEYDEAISGVAMPLDVALQQALLNADAFLLTICANTSVVIKQGSWYAVVDSHAITTDTSCVVYHSTIESLYNYINDMAQLFGQPKPPFEITGVLVHADAEVCDSLEEEVGSSFPCSSVKALYSEVLKGKPKVYTSAETEVRTSDFQVESVKLRQAQMKYPMKMQSKSLKKPMKTKQNGPANSHENVLKDCPQKPLLQGSFHQGDARFGDSRNRQCGAVSLTAVLTSKIKNVLTWTTQDLDGVLVSGTLLYETLRNQGNINDQEAMGRHYIAVHELPRRHVLGNTVFYIEYTDSLTGLVNVDVYDEAVSSVVMPLDVALQQTLLSADAFLLTLSANTCAVIKQGSWYAFVDSHAVKTETSYVAYHSSIQSLYNYIKNIAMSFGVNEPVFEITGVMVHIDAVDTQLLEEDHSSLPCSSDKVLYSKIVKRTPKVCESVMTEVSASPILLPDDVQNATRKNLPMHTNQAVMQSKGKKAKRKKLFDFPDKQLSKGHVEDVVTGEMVITDVTIPDIFFCPLTHEDQQALCKVVLLTNDNSDCNIVINFGPIAGPCQTKSIKADVKYKRNVGFQTRVREYSKKKYLRNLAFKARVREYSKKKYLRNLAFKARVCEYSKKKYLRNLAFKARVREYSPKKYLRNLAFKARVREYSKKKYLRNLAFKARVREYSKKKYLRNLAFKARVCEYSKKKYMKTKKEQKQINSSIAYFRQEISRGPEFVCCVCHRLLFRKQVKECKTECYEKKGEQIAALARRCITLRYVHVCDERCSDNSNVSSAECKLWICPTCHRKILYGQLPAESVSNNMHLVDIPYQLKCLNSLEQHLVARNIPFLKLLCLPRGKQCGCHGPVVCVPVNTSDICNILPRNECEDMMVRIKLKRKLTYKGHYEYKYVHTDRVRNALKYLIRCNRWYKDVEINERWVNSLDEPPENVVCDEMQEQDVENGDEQNDPEEETEEDLTYIKEQCGLLSDTSLQPVDVGSEIIDQHFQDVLNVAPAEGKSPVKLLSDKTNEAKCFPVLFPTGGPTFHDEREVKITLSRYLNARILNADGRFAQNTDFIFYAQYLSELDQIVSNVSIALRKGSDNSLLQAITSDVLRKPESLTKLLNYDEGYKFLRPVRGTPPYWQSTQKDLFALIRQLGIPTFFASFSSADLRWPEMIKNILNQEGKNLNVDELDWSEKCGLIRRNPVTAARMFDHRWHCFLKDVIMSPAQPIGKVIDYFYRVEFQQRGSPHVHCLFWVENAPKLNEDNEDNDALVAAFVDRYITCEIPSEEDTELYETVNSVQKHSVRHSKTCRKKNTVCRFNFPRPPSSRTFISRAYLGKCNDENETASAILKKIKSALTDSDVNFISTDAFFQSIGIDQAVFEKAYKKCSKKKSVVLKRNPNDVWVNQYNKHLIRAWQGNMDIQYVTDAYSVVVYIISYITKAEQEMGLLLQRAQNEAMDGNVEARSALRRLGSIYLHNREISAQEAVYRLTGMHLKECSRKVQFIPIGTDPVKMSLPLRVLQAKHEQSGENSTIWMKSLVDRYKSRPKTQTFDVMCIASFCSEYRILSQSEISSKKSSKDKVVKLNNNCGYMIRRSRTKPAVVRYPRFSPTKDSEKYHHSLLQLFLPHYEDWQLKPDNFNTYEDFYSNGAVKCGSTLASVKCIVDANRAIFEKESDQMDRAQQLLEQGVDLEDAWALLCPETEKERDECLSIKKKKVLADEDDSDTLIPDLAGNAQTAFTIDTSNATMSRDEALSLLRSLNTEQSAIFHKVRKWCLQKVYGENSEPFFLFVTGGAGTGKSHLIKAIYYESCRLLSQLSDNPDDRTVILCASTGVAAYNIGATTIHNTFSIGANVKLPYQPLSDDKINSLRSKMACLQILIIDEMSMVDHYLLSYVHGRLRQIKQTGDYSVFGKVSIVAVGDFYQLPPVKGTPLYADAKGVNLWDNIFKIAELTKVVRQEDASFAEMLNRLRVRKKNEPLNLSDVNMLKQCETGEVCTDIHIFPTNSEVDEYNMLRLHECCPDVISIRARDFVRNPKTGRMEPKVGMHTKVFNSCLSTFVSLGVGARVMLKKNVDVSDGLVNGAFGTVVHVSESQKHDDHDNDFPSAIHVEFDDPNVGKVQRSKQQPRFSRNATVIEAVEDQVTNDGGIRRQFPLKLAWACTVHKVQGLTVDKAVVSLNKIFAPGQAYVALSRVRTIDGLIIQNFKESAIYCNDKIEQAMKNMILF
ncbi:uncharacterized protein [Paramisgurnus dabryanus]|uniref:uncharacterized protein n=1 Tax=Paramisgurnus dabryanus TaxID=90735 RepID=UPI0031F44E79